MEEGENVSQKYRVETAENEKSRRPCSMIPMSKLQIDKINKYVDVDNGMSTNRSIVVSGMKPNMCRGSSRGSIKISAYELYKI